jgi:hypothetical protein
MAGNIIPTIVSGLIVLQVLQILCKLYDKLHLQVKPAVPLSTIRAARPVMRHMSGHICDDLLWSEACAAGGRREG